MTPLASGPTSREQDYMRESDQFRRNRLQSQRQYSFTMPLQSLDALTELKFLKGRLSNPCPFLAGRNGRPASAVRQRIFRPPRVARRAQCELSPSARGGSPSRKPVAVPRRAAI